MELMLSSLFQNVSAVGISLPLVFLLLIVYWLWGRDPNRHIYPPGPGYALPLIGNLYQVGTKPHLTFLKWKKKYGPLTFFKMGSENAVLLNDAKVAKELLSTAAASGRAKGPFWSMFSNSFHGIIFSDGENGMGQRSFAIKTLTELGLSKSGRLEGIILDEVEHIVKYFESRVAAGGDPFTATRLFNEATVSTLWVTLSGERVDWMGKDGVLTESETCRHAGEIMRAVNKTLSTGLTVMPWLRHLPILSSVWNVFKAAADNFHGMVEAKIEEHAETLDALSPRDFIDYGLIKVGATTDPSSIFYKEKGRLNLVTTVKDLFFAGSETTSTALEYLLMFLGTHPQVQEKLQLELDAVIGGRRPTLSDRKVLPYSEAVLMETLRRSVSAAATTHRMFHDVEFQGYLLPKDTLVLLDLYGIHRDPDTWGDADAFRPERFLNEDGSAVVVHESYVPFAPGRRNCIGESLALDTLFLSMTSIFQKFRVEVVHDDNDGTFDLDNVKPGLTLEHEPFDIRVYRRNII